MKSGKKTGMDETKVLPHTRRAEFAVIFKEHFFGLVALSLLTALGSLPLFLWLVGSSMYGLFDESLWGILLTHLVAWPLFLIMGLGFSGLDHSIKVLIYNEGLSLPATFFEGIKKNFRRYLLSFSVLSVLTALLRLGVAGLAQAEDLAYWRSMLSGLMYGVYFLFLWCLLLSNFASVIYRGSFFRLLWNSFGFLCAKPFHSLGVMCLAFIPLFVFEFVPYYQAQAAAYLAGALIYFALSALLIGLLSAYLYDLSINRDYPEIYRKGLDQDEDLSK